MWEGKSMNIKEIFDKATTENKALTYEEFEKLAKDNKAKFADLSEGKYVDRQKYEDDLAKRGTEIDTLNETIKTRDADLSDLQTKLQNAGNDATKLEELSNSLTELQGKYDKDTTELQNRLSAQSYEFAVRDFAGRQKFSSNAAKRDFIESLVKKGLPMENGSIMGADDYLKAYAKDNGDAFLKDTPKTDPAPTFAGPASGDKGGAKPSLSEMMRLKNENPDYVINFD